MSGYKVFLGCNGSDYKKIIKAKPSIAVIDFMEFNDHQIVDLLQHKIKLIAYLNVGAIEKNRSYYSKYKRFAIGDYSDWDEKWMDLSKEEWKNAVISQAGRFKARGALGIYVDNLDVVEEFPKRNLYSHAKDIVKRMHDLGLYLIINGADHFVSRCISEKQVWFSAIQQEEVFTLIKDIEKNKCGSQKSSEKKRLKSYCINVRKQGLDVFLLEYKPSSKNKLKIKSFCRKYGLHYYNSQTVDLV